MLTLRQRHTSHFPIVTAAAGALVPLTVEERQRQALLKQQQTQDASQQIGSLVQQGASLLGAGSGAASAVAVGTGAAGAGAAGAAGAASGLAGAAGPIGLAIGAGMGVDSIIKGATTDENGFAKTSTLATVARSVGSAINPIGTIMNGFSNLSNKDLNGFEKAAGFIPGFSALALRGSVNRARNRYQEQKGKNDVARASVQNQQASYTGLAYARQGGIIPTFADGGTNPKAPKPPALARYTVATPSAQAQDYYKNFSSTAEGLIGQKHDEVYTDPATGKQCTANSCLSFATTLLEKATGTQQPRSKGNLYNPEFTRTSERQGWVQIPLNQAQAGDRLQHWQSVAETGGNSADRVKDLGGRELISGAYPAHMMVLGGKLDEYGDRGQLMAKVYQDGHQFTAADKARIQNVTGKEFVAYRYVGVNGQPTNDPQQAVATNPAAAPKLQSPGQRRVAMRAQGGPTPKKVEPWRQPLSETDEVRYQQWVKKLPSTHQQSIDPATGNGRDYDYRQAFKEGVQAAENGHFTDRYKLPNHRTFSTESMYYGPDTKDQAGKWEPVPGGGNQWIPLNPKVKKPFVEDKEGRPLTGYAEGGQLELPPSVIASGQLHSEKHTLGDLFEKTLTEKGIPIIQLSEADHLNGTQLAELERDELTMSAELSEKIRALVVDKEHHEIGKLVAQQIKTNTIPSARYRRRLPAGTKLSADNTGTPEARQQKSLAMLGEGGSVQMWLKGGVEHIFSREHTAHMVNSSLEAKTKKDFTKLGRRVGSYIQQHQRKAAKTT